MNNQIIAIVVTYNRLPMLQRCIEKLKAQSVACDILIVNNASTDGSASWLEKNKNEEMQVLDTGVNLGGAGGFNAGIRWAVQAGYEYLWLMDDDCFPNPDALEKLMEASALLRIEYGWLSSVALWTDGTECKMNRQKLNKRFYAYSPLLKHGLVLAEQATFVSLFLRSETIHRAGLPIKDFFIWGDDIEFTRRIAVRNGIPSFVVGQSQVIHAMKENIGSSIAIDRAERIDRYRYAFRNEAYLYRKEGIRGICYYLAKCGLYISQIIIKAPDHRWKRIRVLLGSMIEGVFFNPSIEKI